MGITWNLVGAVTAGAVAVLLIGVAYLLFEIPRSKPDAGPGQHSRAAGS